MHPILDGAGVFGYTLVTTKNEADPRDLKMPVFSAADGRTQTGAKVLALACFAVAAGLLIASLFLPSPARAGKTVHPTVLASHN